MAEVQTSDLSGETTQRFIEFIMMQSQQAAFYLGQIPNPQTGQAEVNLDVARMLIDQLAMIRAKTRGNLSNEEQMVMNNALSSLQMAFVEASQGDVEKTPAPASEIESPEKSETPPMAAEPSAPAPAAESESKKKFSKSYGS